ncbi:glutamyl-tRNA(Gln) amidotransferase subunit C, chloroplastic/mitochondrial-like [Bidens hawaiensis]|uniref:glutamyl-tRNA(Gln) amidotransferase subunit C, chloroplastic/mitochondrial-like n=1 Tax=Bidens hawaiensis TaxID=980011 RepID=UPI0040497548
MELLKSFLRVGAREYAVHSSLERPDVARLAETARISLTPQEAEEFAPKIQQVVDWFGQLQDVDLQSVEPAIRPDTEAGSFREDSPETFDNRFLGDWSLLSYVNDSYGFLLFDVLLFFLVRLCCFSVKANCYFAHLRIGIGA